ncbi:hypothetical protein [Coralloluteibacterium thermophilus]|uniref:Exo-alpha-sialidase n=1 Tax=Coralloluteibacterium thermophilum TaxID=2707049 RepID=A0ABV9NP43_9GAMM
MPRLLTTLLGLAALAGPPVSAGGPGAPGTLQVESWALPATMGGQPDLVRDAEGGLLLSWLERTGDGHRLRLARTPDGRRWNAPLTIAEGADWFVNWADTPHVHALPDGSLWAHWLRSTGPGRMDYGIDVVRSGDRGATWSAPRMVNLEHVRGDHGFVTFWSQRDDRLGMAWLDSRQKSSHPAHAGKHHAHGHGGGAMMLRAAVLGADGATRAEWPLDASTCDCCTTDSALTASGVVVVYRGRDDEEVRDIRLTRFDGETWTAPALVHPDGWRIAGCPVNGPAVATDGDTVWVAWYTEAAGTPEIRIARSDDAGASFGTPVSVAEGTEVLGRVALEAADDALWLAWLVERPDGQTLRLARFGSELDEHERVDVARLAARGRASGLPRLAVHAGAAHLVWTDVEDGSPVLRGARAGRR